MSNEELRRVLDRYFEQKIQLRRVKKRKALDVWEPVVKEILEYVTTKDPRFDSVRLLFGGSYYERTKIKEPNEFDLMLEIESLKLGTWDPYDDEDGLTSDPPTGYTTVMIDQGEEVKWKPDKCVVGNLLSSTAIKSTFARLVNQAVRELHLEHKHRLLREIEVKMSGPAVTLVINHENFCGSIDLTLAIHDASWPEDAKDWERKQRNGWPSQSLVKEIVQGGCHLVAKKPKHSAAGGQADFFWRYTFSRAEKKLFTEGSTGAAGTCRRSLLRILKCLREDLQLTPLTTYHLKTVMLHEYEAFPRDTDWETNQMPVRFKSALQSLLKYLQQKRLPYYFIPEINLFEDENFNDQRYQFLKGRVEQLLSNPCACIERFM